MMIWAIMGAVIGVTLQAISSTRKRMQGFATSAFLGAVLIGTLLWALFD